jgi:uncharacterized protein (DUF1800 family)
MPDDGMICSLGRKLAAGLLAALALAACTTTDPISKSLPTADVSAGKYPPAPSAPLLDRVTGGVSQPSLQQLATLGAERFLEQQLSMPNAPLPAEVQAQIDTMTISLEPMERLVIDLEQRRRDIVSMPGDEAKRAAERDYQQELTRLGREAMTRSLLRAVYSPNQLLEQMTWFWMNHFNVFQFKSNVRAMIGDFEQRAIRPHALGRFRDLLAATVYHPAMLRYLDNENNAAGRINENYARELMELHTLGVDGGYSQQDVQELARILTGLGVNLTGRMPNVRRDLAGQYRQDGLFEFNPNRHDYGNKQLLGSTVRGRGLGEVDEVIDRLSRHPATARFISRKLAVYFVTDDPPQALVERMADAYTNSDGDIAATLRVMFRSSEFAVSLGQKFKDPRNYVVSAMRLAYGDKVISNVGPMINWLARMGQPLYGRQTPDGYPMQEMSWNSSGQMATRFEIARAIGAGNAALFASDGAVPTQRPEPPQLANGLYYEALQPRLGTATRRALDSARTPQEWNAYFLSSPEFMHR